MLKTHFIHCLVLDLSNQYAFACMFNKCIGDRVLDLSFQFDFLFIIESPQYSIFQVENIICIEYVLQ